jgi:hypothetical protein
MNWQKVADDLREQAVEAGKHAEALSKSLISRSPDTMMIERAKTVERHRINANFCLALAQALEAGIDE